MASVIDYYPTRDGAITFAGPRTQWDDAADAAIVFSGVVVVCLLLLGLIMAVKHRSAIGEKFVSFCAFFVRAKWTATEKRQNFIRKVKDRAKENQIR